MKKETSEATDNYKRISVKRMSVQAETGEVLTTPEVLEQLENEHKGREKKNETD